MANEYVTKEELKESLRLEGTTYADFDIEVALESASRKIDAECNRRFWLDDDNTSERYYRARRFNVIFVDDVVDIVSVETDHNGDNTFETTWAASDWQAEPLNAALDTKPWTRLRIRESGRYTFPTSHDNAGVKITGQFGWLSVPPEIKNATTILAHRYLKRRREAPFGVVAPGLEGPPIQISRTDPDVYALIVDYIRDKPII